MFGPEVEQMNPPVSRHCFAVLQTAATTEDSSVAMVTSRSVPSITMLVA